VLVVLLPLSHTLTFIILQEDALGREVDRATFFDECHKTKDGVYVNALTEEKMVLTLFLWSDYVLFGIGTHSAKHQIWFLAVCIFDIYKDIRHYACPSNFCHDRMFHVLLVPIEHCFILPT
jgi:hypothetical protein